MLRFIVKHVTNDYQCEPRESFQTIDIDVPELEQAMMEYQGYDAYSFSRLVGVEVIPDAPNASSMAWDFGPFVTDDPDYLPF